MQIKVFLHGSSEYKLALALRDKVLRKPLGIAFTAEELAKDINDVHIGMFEGEELIACLTLTEDGGERMKMRQVAVSDNHQRKGLGRQLSLAAEEYAVGKGREVLFCNARKTAVPFYHKLGYRITSAEFTEVTIPHYRMEKQLKRKQ